MIAHRLPSLAVATLFLIGCAGPQPSSSAAIAPSPPTGSPTTSQAPVPSSSDGPSASPAPNDIEAVGATEGTLNTLWIEGDLVVAGGFSGPAFASTILVFGDDGWSVAQTPAAPGQVTAITAFDGRLIAVGNGLPDVLDGFIWDSTDGRIWNEVATFKGASIHDVIATDSRVVAVGASLDAETNATATAWSSADGTIWRADDIPEGARTAMGAIADRPDGFAAIGDRPLGQPRPFWTTPTEPGWASVENDLDDQLLPIDLVAWDGRYAIVGGSGRSGDQHPFVALSDDGRSWGQTNLSTDEGYASAVVVGSDGLVIAGVDADRLTVWRESGEAWEAKTIEPMGASISAMLVDAERGLIAVGSRDGQHAIWAIPVS